jgi:hypothetical protein
MVRIELTDEECRLLREALTIYLTEFRREIAGTENPDFRDALEQRETVLSRLLERLRAEAA